MGRIARQKESAVPDRLHRKASHGGDTFLEDLASTHPLTTGKGQAPLQILSDTLIRPFRKVLVRFTLKIEPRDAG